MVFVMLPLAASGADGGAWVSQGRTVKRFQPGEVPLSSTIRLAFEPFSLSMTGDGTVMYVNDTCAGDAKMRLRYPQGNEATVPGLSALLHGRRARVDGLALAASGQLGAFVIRPCTKASVVEVSEALGVVHLVFIRDLRIGVVRGSLDDVGVPVGMATNPTFSDDEKFLLVNYDGGFEIFNVESGRSVFMSTEIKALSEGWAGALGWIAGDCIAVKSGRDHIAAGLEPPMVVNWLSRKIRPLADLPGASTQSLIGLTEARSEYGMRRTSQGWQLVPLRRGGASTPLSKDGMAGLTAASMRGGAELCHMRE
jgi:hypothetical protein